MKDKIVKLREETGAGIMDCKNALKDADGDMDKARDIIKEKGLARADKKAERKTGSGVIESYIHNSRVGVLLELRCETDFVARNEEFVSLAHDIAMQVASMNPESVEDLLAQDFIKDGSVTVGDELTRVISKMGENMKIERFCRYEL